MPRFGHTAVDRNLVKRRLRELMRTEFLATLPDVDVVVRANPAAYGATYEELRGALREWHRKAQSSTEWHRGARSSTEKHG